MLIMAAAYIISIFSSRTTIWDLSVNAFGTLQKSNSTNPFEKKKGKRIEIKKGLFYYIFLYIRTFHFFRNRTATTNDSSSFIFTDLHKRQSAKLER